MNLKNFNPKTTTNKMTKITKFFCLFALSLLAIIGIITPSSNAFHSQTGKTNKPDDLGFSSASDRKKWDIGMHEFPQWIKKNFSLSEIIAQEHQLISDLWQKQNKIIAIGIILNPSSLQKDDETKFLLSASRLIKIDIEKFSEKKWTKTKLLAEIAKEKIAIKKLEQFLEVLVQAQIEIKEEAKKNKAIKMATILEKEEQN